MCFILFLVLILLFFYSCCCCCCCCCCFFFFNEYVTMNVSERPGINALKTSLTMLVKEHRKYHF